MTKEPLISVVMPIYNSSEYLHDSVSSIVKQSYKNFELLIVDDSQTDDGSIQILKAFNDDRIKYIKPKDRLGLVKSINYAIGLANGEYIARMDADDISHSDRFKLQIDYMIKHPEVGVVGCNCYTINNRNIITGAIEHPIENLDIKVGMLINARFIHPAVMIRKEILKHEMYSEQCFCCEDYELWSRLMFITEFHNIPEKLFKYRIIDKSAMHSQLEKLTYDIEYYKRHLSIIKLAYDNVFKFFDVQNDELPIHYEDYIFAKRTESYSLKEKETFIFVYQKLLEQHITEKKQSKKNCAYLWLKLTKKSFWRTRSFKLACGSIHEAFIYVSTKVLSVLSGMLGDNTKVYNWNIKK